MTILSIIGARPQFVKASVVSRLLRTYDREILLHTGQHYDANMSGIFFEELGMPEADINLGVGSGTHAEQTALMLVGIEKVILAEHPDWVLVYGDTNSTLAGALAAAKLHVPVEHVEAGLRSYNREMPEDINRLLTDQISDALFCPTQHAAGNLAREGVTRGVHVVGDVMMDALTGFIDLARRQSGILSDLSLQSGSYALMTVHRAANTDDPDRLHAILTGAGRCGLPVIFPVHPRTRAALQSQGISIPASVRMVDPVGYLDMLQLEASANCILTDSGGVQKEAYWLGVRCITLREETEWVETVELGWNCLVGADENAIVRAVQGWQPPAARPDVYGDGRAAEKIAAVLFQQQG